MLRRLTSALTRPVDATPLAAFRIAFGLIVAWELVTCLRRGWIEEHFAGVRFHFTYEGFGWVRPLPAEWMSVAMAAIAVAALAVAAGLLYRVAAALVFVGFTWFFLLERARYLNHFYLICLLAALLALVPAHRALSLDARLRPSLRGPVPAWPIWLLRLQWAVVYFFAGIAKLDPDWRAGRPLRIWFGQLGLLPEPGFWQDALVLGASWGALLFDLLLAPALLWRRTRPAAVVVAIAFHLTNSRLFDVGAFPWLGLASLLLFVPMKDARDVRPAAKPRLLVPAMALWLGLQLLVPLRHLAYPGRTSWTEEGHRFSWRMKLRDKRGSVRFFASEPETGERWEIPLHGRLAPFQIRSMAVRPDLIHQYARHLAKELSSPGRPIEIRALVEVSLNGREPAVLVDPEVDLASIAPSLKPARWIVPLPAKD